MSGLSKEAESQYEDNPDERLHLVQSLCIPRMISPWLAITDQKSSVS